MSYKIILKGGMGNQLFQLANGISLCLRDKHSLQVKFAKGSREYNLGWLGIKVGKLYNLEKFYASGEITEIYPSYLPKIYSQYKEPSFTFTPIPSLKKNTIIEGYFQSFRYFTEFEPYISNFLKNHLSFNTQPRSNQITLHIRLGDMARNLNARKFHGILNSMYYIKAIEHMNLNSPEFVVVTDDPEMFYREHNALIKYMGKYKITSQANLEDFTALAS